MSLKLFPRVLLTAIVRESVIGNHTDLNKVTCQVQLDMDWLCSGTAAIETGCLVEKMIVELTSETSPWILVFPDQDTRVLCPHS